MRLPQRFERLPSEEARDGQDIQLSEYPPDTKMNTKEHVKGNVGHDYQSVPIETGYNAAAYHAHNKDASQPSRIIDRIEAAEKTKFGTRYFNQFHALFLGGWRGGLLRSFVFSFVALVANFAIYGWLFGTYNTKMGTAVIRTGSCRSIRWDNTAIHAALNIVSTLILGASTYAMQGMTAPTRPDVDRAHAKGRWLEIGTQSLRNLPFVRKSNTWTWLLLGITSLPYHLLYVSTQLATLFKCADDL